MTAHPSQLVLDVMSGANTMTLESFFEGPCNAQALAEVLDGGTWGDRARVLTGGRNAGKTHLSHIFAAKTGAVILRPERLAADTVPNAEAAPALVLEDAHTLPDAPLREVIAFHLFNQARDLAQPMLITGRGAVRDWGLDLPDLSSRLTASAQLRVTNPDEDTLRMVLVKLFSDRQLAVRAETVEYALYRMERSFAAALSLVEKLDRSSLRQNRRIDKSLIRDTLNQQEEGDRPPRRP